MTADEVSDTSDATTRDRVWGAVLDLATDRPIGFKLWRVRERAGLDESKDRTIRRTLNAMAELDWLEHEPEKKWWNLGPNLHNRQEHTVAKDVDPLAVIDERIEHLEGYPPRDQSHEDRLEERKTELEIVRHRMTADEPVMMTDGGASGRSPTDQSHGKQAGPPYEWGVAKIDGQEYVVYDKPEGLAGLFRKVDSTRNLRIVAQAEAVLYRGHLLWPNYDASIKSVIFEHDFGGRMFNQPVDGWLRKPAHLLEEIHVAQHLLDFPEDES